VFGPEIGELVRPVLEPLYRCLRCFQEFPGEPSAIPELVKEPQNAAHVEIRRVEAAVDLVQGSLHSGQQPIAGHGNPFSQTIESVAKAAGRLTANAGGLFQGPTVLPS